MKTVGRILCGISLLISSTAALAALPGGLRAAPPKLDKSPPWMLGAFLELSRKDPDRLIRISEKLFAPERMKLSERDPVLSYEWQHRLAAVNSLSDFFDPEHKTSPNLREHSRNLIQRALLEDPSLLVRDGAVEAVRRIFRMNPEEAKRFSGILEKAFLDRRNVLDGEGFFIRETILVAMREGSLRPSNRVRKAALSDGNSSVRERLDLWKTNSYDSISTR